MALAEVRAAPTEVASPPPQPAHSIPSLDGLRAASIAIVILSHTRSLLPAGVADSGLFRYVIGGGLHGVQIFFVLSGYLITTLLLREYHRTGAFSFKRFYARRCLRIFPPFYVYFAVLGVLWITGRIPQHWPTYLAAATYTFIYLPHPQGWLVLHSWSLSIEEQFYLLWPALLFFFCLRRPSLKNGLHRGPHLALAALAALAIARLFPFPDLSHPTGTALHTLVTIGSVDTLMVGCLLAHLQGNDSWQRFCRRYLRAPVVFAALVVGFVLIPYVSAKVTASLASTLITALGPTITALSIGALVVYAIENADSLTGRVLNLPLLRHIGVISYSLYLWQQFFTSDTAPSHLYNYALMLIAAELSFWYVEKPAMRLRTRLNL